MEHWSYAVVDIVRFCSENLVCLVKFLVFFSFLVVNGVNVKWRCGHFGVLHRDLSFFFSFFYVNCNFLDKWCFFHIPLWTFRGFPQESCAFFSMFGIFPFLSVLGLFLVCPGFVPVLPWVCTGYVLIFSPVPSMHRDFCGFVPGMDPERAFLGPLKFGDNLGAN